LFCENIHPVLWGLVFLALTATPRPPPRRHPPTSSRSIRSVTSPCNRNVSPPRSRPTAPRSSCAAPTPPHHSSPVVSRDTSVIFRRSYPPIPTTITLSSSPAASPRHFRSLPHLPPALAGSVLAGCDRLHDRLPRCHRTHPSAYGGGAWRDSTYYSFEGPRSFS